MSAPSGCYVPQVQKVSATIFSKSERAVILSVFKILADKENRHE